MRPKDLKVCIWIGLLLLLLSSTAWSQNPMKLKTGKKHAPVKTEENLTLPEHLGAENIDHFMAGLSDEQVRRLLINELKAQAQKEDDRRGQTGRHCRFHP